MINNTYPSENDNSRKNTCIAGADPEGGGGGGGFGDLSPLNFLEVKIIKNV